MPVIVAPGRWAGPARARTLLQVADPATSDQGTRVLTVPNLLSLLRLAGVPLFLYLLLGPRADGWAILVLAVGGFTDWLDGKLARLLNQQSRLGALLDPAVDRLYILAALVALGAREVIPWWAVAVLIARDLVLAATLPVLRRHGYRPVPGQLPREERHLPAALRVPAAAARPGQRVLAGPGPPDRDRLRGLGDGDLPLLRAAVPGPVRTRDAHH